MSIMFHIMYSTVLVYIILASQHIRLETKYIAFRARLKMSRFVDYITYDYTSVTKGTVSRDGFGF